MLTSWGLAQGDLLSRWNYQKMPYLVAQNRQHNKLNIFIFNLLLL